MPEPVDPAGDYLVTRGNAGDVLYRAYDPDADAHAAEADGVTLFGVKGPSRTAEEGGRVVTRATWTVTGQETRPVLRSLLVAGDETWVVETATPSPASSVVFVCECVLNG